MVDTLGNLLEVVVHAAGIQDYHGAKELLLKLSETVTSLQKLWADSIYKCCGLVEWVQETFRIILEIVERQPGQKGFVVLPRQWVVERTFAWLGRYRRLSKDYERCTKSSEGMVYIASIHTMMKRPGACCVISKYALRVIGFHQRALLHHRDRALVNQQALSFF